MNWGLLIGGIANVIMGSIMFVHYREETKDARARLDYKNAELERRRKLFAAAKRSWVKDKCLDD